MTRPERRTLVLHGDDAPMADWLERVVDRFDLDRRSIRLLFDEHEQTFTQDRRAVNAEFGLSIGPSRHEGGQARC